MTEAAPPNTAIKGIEVTAYPAAGGEEAATALTNGEGKYTLTVPAGQYKVEFAPPRPSALNFAPQYWEGVATFAAATTITLAEGEAKTAVNAKLSAGGVIEGKVTSEEAGYPPPKTIEVTAFESGGESFVGAATAEAGGKYRIVGLPTGEYVVSFAPGLGENFVTEYWNQTPVFAKATQVKVTQGATTSAINAELPVGGEISGTVTDASTHKVLAGVNVAAYGPGGGSGETIVAFATTNSVGDYLLVGLPTGSYKVEFFGTVGESASAQYSRQYYSGEPTLALANPVSVLQTKITAAINAALVPLAPVDVTAPVASGTTAVGQALSCSPGAWTGSPAPAFSYQWLRDGAPIAGATGTGYVVQSADQGHAFACEVTAVNTHGRASARSNALSVPAPPPPPPKPLIGLARIATLTVSGGAVHVTLVCRQATCRGTVEIVRQIRVRVRVGHRKLIRTKTLVLAKGAYATSAGHRVKVLLRLTSVGRRTLLHARHHRILAEIVGTVSGGANVGEPVLLRLRR